MRAHGEMEILTSRENHPNEIHEKVITPEIEELWSRVRDTLIIVVEHASGIVED